MSFVVRNLSKFSNAQELRRMTSMDDIFIEKVNFHTLKFNNDGNISIEFGFNNKDGRVDFLSKDDIGIIFNVFGDDISIKYNSFEMAPIEAIIQDDMAVIHQIQENGISLNIKYTMKPSLRFRIANL